jgi:hypothetical protein
MVNELPFDPHQNPLNAVQTKGCNWIAFPSINFGWNACIPNLCKVGARFSKMDDL